MPTAKSLRFPAARALASSRSTPGGAVGKSCASRTSALITLSKVSVHYSRLTARDAAHSLLLQVARHAGRRRGLVFDLCFALRAIAPGDIDHAGAILALLQKRLAIARRERAAFEKRFCLLIQRILYRGQ